MKEEQLKSLILQLGVGGILALAILFVVFKYGYPALKAKKANGPRCLHMPEVRGALERNLLSSKTIDRVENKVDDLQTESTEQTTYLKIISTQSGEQTKLLQRLVNKK